MKFSQSEVFDFDLDLVLSEVIQRVPCLDNVVDGVIRAFRSSTPTSAPPILLFHQRPRRRISRAHQHKTPILSLLVNSTASSVSFNIAPTLFKVCEPTLVGPQIYAVWKQIGGQNDGEFHDFLSSITLCVSLRARYVKRGRLIVAELIAAQLICITLH